MESKIAPKQTENTRSLARRLHGFPLFGQASETTLIKLASDGEIQSVRVSAGERIGGTDHGVSCIVSGRAAVYSRDEERPVLLRYLNTGELFGVASVYSDEPTLSRVVAKRETVLLRVSGRAIRELLDTEPKFREAYIAFLSDRIRFLNLRIMCVSAGSAEHKLGLFLCSVSAENEFDLPIGISDLANLLDLGRASLYRAFDKLSALGYIKRNGVHVEVTDRRALLAVSH